MGNRAKADRGKNATNELPGKIQRRHVEAQQEERNEKKRKKASVYFRWKNTAETADSPDENRATR
jgi:hypothetical protein